MLEYIFPKVEISFSGFSIVGIIERRYDYLEIKPLTHCYFKSSFFSFAETRLVDCCGRWLKDETYNTMVKS